MWLYTLESQWVVSMVVSSHIILLQKQEEAQSNNLVSTADIDNEAIIKLVSDAVTGILTRLQSEFRRLVLLWDPPLRTPLGPAPMS